MWAFLITEIMFFGGLFAGYAVYRMKSPEGFAEASHHLDIALGGVNTAVLIASSLTMALTVRAAQMGSRRFLMLFLILTIALGSVFLGVKVVEYTHKFEESLIPGRHFNFEGMYSRTAEMFFFFYFAMTGMHALHMIIGVGLMLALLVMAHRGRFSPEYYSPVELSGLYWHFVYIVWIFLFPLLYLIGRH
ncbi:MAG: cytochrome c oxidase subunit 3 family protein [Acidobacteria bacterium]|nr:cytochrome c oxidase subunit 3 family protein [Acidobacteriota bacterium]